MAPKKAADLKPGDTVIFSKRQGVERTVKAVRVRNGWVEVLWWHAQQYVEVALPHQTLDVEEN